MRNDRIKIKKHYIIFLILSGSRGTGRERDFLGRGGKEVTDLDGMKGLPAAAEDDKERITDQFGESGQSDGRRKAAAASGPPGMTMQTLNCATAIGPAKTATNRPGHSTTEPNRTH
ncbi:uncharacterized protein PGTG_10283 [Puccinia graminis f. sp. tritici CRL 75-36-700-3]|uniref:Uncharacterized protein n=1 Tax=Puccinia graminis f. sp. tritici (strain CRL 75-36-700-3 / race SCCL) TaxID=418459 RepID=E3KKI7_PUCGT|nr:uncharacterized protein PGTG_10283 [Puccinia graminis f. sp. tritici CRL 75-36-700-3]EFP84812.1 hypothetical protein PGTG_10283 [Puccinia graminis f. sp. tritici CRL 75-36-700-3]